MGIRASQEYAKEYQYMLSQVRALQRCYVPTRFRSPILRQAIIDLQHQLDNLDQLPLPPLEGV